MIEPWKDKGNSPEICFKPNIKKVTIEMTDGKLVVLPVVDSVVVDLVKYEVSGLHYDGGCNVTTSVSERHNITIKVRSQDPIVERVSPILTNENRGGRNEKV